MSSASKNRGPRCLRLTKGDGPTPIYSWATDGAWLTECSTRNTGESPSVAVECSLSQTLEANAPATYSLSARACQGILDRAKRRGRELPEILKTALEARSTGYADEVSPTIRAGAVPAALCLERLLYSIGSFNSFAWLSGNPHAGVHQTDRARTLDNGGGNPAGQQGGLAIVETYAMTTGSYMQVDREVTPPLMARDYKDPITVNSPLEYRVRRLMPIECARLQGFPDGWCSGLGMDDPEDSEIEFWVGVFEEHRRLITHAKKPKTKAQIVKWIQHPHTDSAEYKLWGNGCALPCVYFVLDGIAKVNG